MSTLSVTKDASMTYKRSQSGTTHTLGVVPPCYPSQMS